MTSSRTASSARSPRASSSCTRIPTCFNTPLVRRDGELVEASWDEAFEAVAEGLGRVLDEGGRDAVAVYLGNPSAHSLGPTLYGPALLKAIGTKNIYSASTVDQMPKQVAAGLMFGGGLSVPIPDVDRTDYFLILGANPLVSNGSLLTAPDMRGRIRAIRERGGKVVVVDPRRSRTAKEASEHHFIRPGTDAHLLFAIVNVLIAEDLADPGGSPRWRTAPTRSSHWRDRSRRRPSRPSAVSRPARSAGSQRELATAERAAVYGRIGTTTQRFGTLASWLVDVINFLTGNLDREGGAMFALAAAGQRNSSGRGPTGRGVITGAGRAGSPACPSRSASCRWSALTGEITTPGEGQVRALITIAGNPLVSTPDSAALTDAVADLDFMVSVDIYVNETTRHADVILPAPEPLAKAHYDTALYQLAIRFGGELVAGDPAACRRPPARVGDHPAPRGDRRRPGPRRRPRGLGRPRHPDAYRPGGRLTGSPIEGREPRRSRPRSAIGAALSGSSTSSCASAPSARDSAPMPTA